MYVFTLIIFTLTETLCCTYLLKSGQHTGTISIAYFISGLFIGTFPLIKFNKENSKHYINQKFTSINKALLWGFFVFILFYFIFLATRIMQSIAIDYKTADMLPQIKVMCQRLLSGQQVYAPIQEIWNGKQPPYVPLMWLPFVPADYLMIDMRWTTIAFILCGLFFTFRILQTNNAANPLLLCLSLISLFILINFILVKDKTIIGWTEEGVVIGYYLLLGYALVKNNPVLMSVAIACCLLSRFSLFFWVPMFVCYVFFFESRKNALTIAALIGLIVLFVFLIPFGFKQPEYFLNIPSDYHVGVDRAWEFNLHNGKYYADSLGFAKFFNISHIRLIHNLQIVISAVVPLIFILLYWRLKNKFRFDATFFGLCSLKTSLVFFYNFLEVPYFYLYFVPTFFSYTILFKYLSTAGKRRIVINEFQ